jgi:hypothetical protein
LPAQYGRFDRTNHVKRRLGYKVQGLPRRKSIAIGLSAWSLTPGMACVAYAANLSQVPIPKLELGASDSLDPLPPTAPSASDDPRNFEGTWTGLGRKRSADGLPRPFRPPVTAELLRLRDLDRQGKPVVVQSSLCRPGTMVDIGINQFPTQVLQRPDEILFIAEEGRTIRRVFLNRSHPQHVKPSLSGDHVGHWEGNTLVIDSIGFRDTPIDSFAGGNSAALHVITRIERANTGDRRNGDRLVITRTIDDPKVFTHSWTQVGVARWRPDLDMLEFNCEESSPELAAEGLTVK